jgi:hypothetical protein
MFLRLTLACIASRDIFDELKFLNKSRWGRAPPRKPKTAIDEESSTNGQPSEFFQPGSPTRRKIAKDSAISKKSPSSERSSVGDSVSQSKPLASFLSEEWDIERGEPLPSGSSVRSVASGKAPASTVLADDRLPGWAATEVGPPASPLPEDRVTAKPRVISPSTIAPWQSASQCGIRPTPLSRASATIRKALQRETESRYFVKPAAKAKANESQKNAMGEEAPVNSQLKPNRIPHSSFSPGEEALELQELGHPDHDSPHETKVTKDNNSRLDKAPSVSEIAPHEEPAFGHKRASSSVSSLQQALRDYDADPSNALQDYQFQSGRIEEATSQIDLGIIYGYGDDDKFTAYPDENPARRPAITEFLYGQDTHDQSSAFLFDWEIEDFEGQNDGMRISFPPAVFLNQTPGSNPDVCTYDAEQFEASENYVSYRAEDLPEDAGLYTWPSPQLYTTPSALSEATIAEREHNLMASPNFTQGQTLLQRVGTPIHLHRVSDLENDVARGLHGHWTPQHL